MKLEKIRIKNYKSILDQTIDGFTHVNMVFGHNNSGKSNYLKFINYVFCKKFSGNDLPRVDESRLGVVPILEVEATSNFWSGIIRNVPYIFRNNDRKKNIEFEVIFNESVVTVNNVKYFDQLKAQYFLNERTFSIEIKGEISASGLYDAEIKLTEASLNGKKIFNDSTTTYFETATPESDLSENGYEAFDLLLSFFNDSVLFIDNDRYFSDELENPQIKHLTPRNFKNWVHNLTLDSERFYQLKKITKDVISFKPDGDSSFVQGEKSNPINSDFQFQFSRLDKALNLMVSNSHDLRVPIENFGTGIQQVLYLLSKIAEKEPRILLIEELELNLSPKYQMELLQHFLLKYIEKSDIRLKQLIFTTHAPNLCFRTDFQIHKVTINNSGQTIISRLGRDKEVIKEFYPPETINWLIEQTAS